MRVLWACLRAEDTHCWGKYPCTGGPLFNKTGLTKRENMLLFVCSEAVKQLTCNI